MDNKTPRESFNFGITREWRDNPPIAIISTEGNMARDAVDEWTSVVRKTVQEWDFDTPMCILADLSSPAQGITPYSLKCAEDIYMYMANTSSSTVYLSILLRDTLLIRLTNTILRRLRARTKKIQTNFTTSREQALQWLVEEPYQKKSR